MFKAIRRRFRITRRHRGYALWLSEGVAVHAANVGETAAVAEAFERFRAGSLNPFA